MVGPLD